MRSQKQLDGRQRSKAVLSYPHTGTQHQQRRRKFPTARGEQQTAQQALPLQVQQIRRCKAQPVTPLRRQCLPIRITEHSKNRQPSHCRNREPVSCDRGIQTFNSPAACVPCNARTVPAVA